jgi:hypothetical protein
VNTRAAPTRHPALDRLHQAHPHVHAVWPHAHSLTRGLKRAQPAVHDELKHDFGDAVEAAVGDIGDELAVGDVGELSMSLGPVALLAR